LCASLEENAEMIEPFDPAYEPAEASERQLLLDVASLGATRIDTLRVLIAEQVPSARFDGDALLAVRHGEADVRLTVAVAGDEAGLERLDRATRGQNRLLVAWRDPSVKKGAELERAGARAIVENAIQIIGLFATERQAASFSIVLLAFNEEQLVVSAIDDARRFLRFFFNDYQVILVDDGSRDRTRSLALSCDRDGDVHVISHETNRGMGAGLKTGFINAKTRYVAPLAADRQLRPWALIEFLPRMRNDHVVVGYYDLPHAGGVRRVLSAGFRLAYRHLGGMQIPFDGTYVFEPRKLREIDWRCVRCESFVLSYELLEQLRRVGCSFEHLAVWPLLREVGSSRVARPGRIARVMREILASRARSLQAKANDWLP
jgi:cellulose synthase/poly-beta-1,6-N-acetylglucosamine synthase-like glycosyltransferase